MSKILKPSKTLVLPPDVTLGQPINIPLVQALKQGLATPERRVRGRVIPAAPAGMGVFAKTAIQILNENGVKALEKAAPEDRARIIARHAVQFRSPRTGKMVRKLESPCHSFTRNFGFWIRGMFQNDGATLNVNETLTDDAGNSFTCRIKATGLNGSNTSVSGLAKMKFGNSNAALSTTQTNLQGTLLGPTTEATVVVTLTVEDSTNTIFTVVGQITNGTGGSFTVQEMGLFSELTDSTPTTNRTTMMLRDLTGAVVVNNGQTIIGTYTFTIAV
jgi:hypothetical protein